MSRFTMTYNGIQNARTLKETSCPFEMTEDEANAVGSWVREHYDYDPDTCLFGSCKRPTLPQAKRMMEAGVRACVHD